MSAALMRPPRLVRKSEAFLADRLEQGEPLISAVRVRTGSLLIDMLITLLALGLLFAIGDTESTGFDWVTFVGFVAIVMGSNWWLQKPRILALTDRRLFVLRTTPWDRVVDVEMEERRETIRSTLVSSDRVLVSGKAFRPIWFRGWPPWRNAQRAAQYLRDWATPLRPDV